MRQIEIFSILWWQLFILSGEHKESYLWHLSELFLRRSFKLSWITQNSLFRWQLSIPFCIYRNSSYKEVIQIVLNQTKFLCQQLPILLGEGVGEVRGRGVEGEGGYLLRLTELLLSRSIRLSWVTNSFLCFRFLLVSPLVCLCLCWCRKGEFTSSGGRLTPKGSRVNTRSRNTFLLLLLMNVSAQPMVPSLPARPIWWMYSSTVGGMSKLMTWWWQENNTQTQVVSK